MKGEKTMNEKYEIVLIERPLDEGLSMEEIQTIWSKLKTASDGQVYACPLEIKGTQSKAMGFIVQGEEISKDEINQITSMLEDINGRISSPRILCSRNIDFVEQAAESDEGGVIAPCVTIQAKKLPKGYVWEQFDDLSGSLHDPDGKRICEYDFCTREYKLPIAPYPHWEDVPDGLLLDKFKEYAEDRVILLSEHGMYNLIQ